MPSDSTSSTDQERLWSGHFGYQYQRRNTGDGWVASNTAFSAEVLNSMQDVESVFEIGTNTGLNVRALQRLLPDADIAALEINEQAVDELEHTGRPGANAIDVA